METTEQKAQLTVVSGEPVLEVPLEVTERAHRRWARRVVHVAEVAAAIAAGGMLMAVALELLHRVAR